MRQFQHLAHMPSALPGSKQDTHEVHARNARALTDCSSWPAHSAPVGMDTLRQTPSDREQTNPQLTISPPPAYTRAPTVGDFVSKTNTMSAAFAYASPAAGPSLASAPAPAPVPAPSVHTPSITAAAYTSSNNADYGGGYFFAANNGGKAVSYPTPSASRCPEYSSHNVYLPFVSHERPHHYFAVRRDVVTKTTSRVSVPSSAPVLPSHAAWNDSEPMQHEAYEACSMLPPSALQQNANSFVLSKMQPPMQIPPVTAYSSTNHVQSVPWALAVQASTHQEMQGHQPSYEQVYTHHPLPHPQVYEYHPSMPQQTEPYEAMFAQSQALLQPSRQLPTLPAEAASLATEGVEGVVTAPPGHQAVIAHLSTLGLPSHASKVIEAVVIKPSWSTHLRVPCRYCEMSFRSKVDTTRHERVHTGEKPFGCTVCHKRFRQEVTLREHTRTHDPAHHQEFPCLHCEKRFAHRRSLQRHLREFHADLHPGEGSAVEVSD